MKKVYLLMFLPLLSLLSCGVDEVLKAKKNFTVSIAQAENPIKTNLGDTVTINLLASTNNGEVKRIELTGVPSGVKEIRDEISFGLVDNDTPLTIDKDGFLSRSVSTVMMVHKFLISKDDALFDKEITISYRVASGDGEVKDISAIVKIMNYINNSKMAEFPRDSAKKGMFLDPVENKVYTKETYKANKSKIEMVVYANASNKYFCLNPAAESTEVIMKSIGFDDYDASEMRNTKFVLSPKIFDYYMLDAEQLKALTFEGAIDNPTLVTDNICSFITQDGKKGCMRIKVASNVFMVASKMEAVVR